MNTLLDVVVVVAALVGLAWLVSVVGDVKDSLGRIAQALEELNALKKRGR